MRIEDKIVLQVDVVVVLDDAAGLHVWHGEGLGEVLTGFRLVNHFVEGLAIKIDDGAVGVDGPGFQVADAGSFPLVGNFDVGVFAPLFAKNLDAEVVVFGGRAGGILAVDLAVEVDGGSAGGFGLTGHFEVGGVDGQPVVTRGGGEERPEEQSCGNENQKESEAAEFHARLLMLEMGAGRYGVGQSRSRAR